jgi:organic radical activating enzyme
MVVNENLLPRELDMACSIIQKIDRSIPLILQPVFGSDPARLLEIQSRALESLEDVRVIPQIHKYLHLK